MFGDNVKKCRMAAGISQRALAKQLNISQQAVGNWEVNRAVPSPDTVMAVAKILNVSASYLLGETDDPTPPNAPVKVSLTPTKQELVDAVQSMTDEQAELFLQLVHQVRGKK